MLSLPVALTGLLVAVVIGFLCGMGFERAGQVREDADRRRRARLRD